MTNKEKWIKVGWLSILIMTTITLQSNVIERDLVGVLIDSIICLWAVFVNLINLGVFEKLK